MVEQTYRRKIQRGSGFWPWLIQRVSGMAIGVLLFLHLWQRHYGNEGNSVTFQSSAERLENPFWLGIALLFLLAILFHAINGTRGILLDYIQSAGKRRGLLWLSWGLLGIFILIYLYFLLPFIRY